MNKPTNKQKKLNTQLNLGLIKIYIYHIKFDCILNLWLFSFNECKSY